MKVSPFVLSQTRWEFRTAIGVLIMSSGGSSRFAKTQSSVFLPELPSRVISMARSRVLVMRLTTAVPVRDESRIVASRRLKDKLSGTNLKSPLARPNGPGRSDESITTWSRPPAAVIVAALGMKQRSPESERGHGHISLQIIARCFSALSNAGYLLRHWKSSPT